MTCKFCKSERLYLKEDADGKFGLYCSNCNKWQQWVPAAELDAVRREIDYVRNSVRVGLSDIDVVLERIRQYKIKLANLNTYVDYYKKRSESASKLEKETIYQKLLSIKDLKSRIDTYNEVLELLKLDSTHLKSMREV